MAQDISGLYISQSFQNLVQRSASGAFNVLATATGTEFIPVSASYAISSSRALSASSADTVLSASYAQSASRAVSASRADSALSSSYALSSSRAVSASRADSALSASYALSSSYAVTASFAENAATANLQEVLTAGNSASLGFNVTGSSVVSGSLRVKKKLISGEDNNTSTSTGPVAIIGGENNTIDGSTQYGGIFGATRGTVTSADASVIAGGFFNEVRGSYNAIVGGTRNLIDNGGAVRKGNVIVGGSGSLIPSTVSGSIILGGQFITASTDNTVYTPGLDVKGGATISGSGKTQDTNLDVIGNATIRNNTSGTNARLLIQDDAQSSFTDGPTLQFSGSNTGLIKSAPSTNMRFDFERDFIFNVGAGGTGAQFSIDLTNNQSGDFRISDAGHRDARYEHENLVNTGSIRFANTTRDIGIGLRMDKDQVALQQYSGSAFVPILRRPSGSRQLSLFDSTNSTGSSGQVLSSNANGGIEWADDAGGAAFPFSGSAQITGSLAVTGSTVITLGGSANSGNSNKNFTSGNGNTNNGNNAHIFGNSHTIQSGETSVIVGGENNTINSSYVGIFGAAASQISNADTSVILGGYQNEVQASRTYTVGGNDIKITNSGAEFSGIIGGQGHRISSAVTASSIIGGKNITATKNETVYVPGLEVVTHGANITGSVIGSSNGAFGQSAAAFSSDAITLGNAGVPVQYGNMVIYGSNTRDLGNKFNGFQIITAGSNTVSLANSAFTGRGNDVHMITLGGNNAGATDNIKLWASGSDDTLHFSSTASFDEVVVLMPNLPTSNPGVTGQLWNDSGTLKIS